MDIRKIKKLMELLKQSDMAEIEIVEGEESIRISRYGNLPVVSDSIPTSVLTSDTSAYTPLVTTKTQPVDLTHGHHFITSPMVGTFYSAASPTSNAFISVGQHINQGDTICIVEAMKIMNQIKADKSGIVVEILCSDGDAVEYGHTLVIVQ